MQLLGDEDRYKEVTKKLLDQLLQNYNFRLDFLFHERAVVMQQAVESLEFGITPEIILATCCNRDYYFEATVDTQLAADAYTRPVAVFDTRAYSPSALYLPFTIPQPPNMQPRPVNLLLNAEDNHFVVIDLVPNLARHLTWPCVRIYHKEGWISYLGHSVDYKTTWRYLSRAKVMEQAVAFFDNIGPLAIDELYSK